MKIGKAAIKIATKGVASIAKDAVENLVLDRDDQSNLVQTDKSIYEKIELFVKDMSDYLNEYENKNGTDTAQTTAFTLGLMLYSEINQKCRFNSKVFEAIRKSMN